MQFFTLLTNVGAAKIANARILQQSVNFKSIAIGDGDGSYPTISTTDTALVNEVYRSDIIDFSKALEGDTQVMIESYVPATVGDFYVREVGVYDTDGDLVAIGVYPETYKPILTSGAAKDLKLRLVLEVGSVENVTVTIDPNIIVASRSWVDDRFLANKTVTKVINSNYVSNNNESLFVNTTQGEVTITLPTPEHDLKVWVTDVKSNFDTNKLTLLRDGATIMGLNEDMDITQANVSILMHCIEVEPNLYDWRVR